MPYDSWYQGVIEISPPADPALTARVNEFCRAMHGEGKQIDPGCPHSICHLVVSEDGARLMWNGEPNSHDMWRWVITLIEQFFRPACRLLTGEIHVQGERADDRWTIVVLRNTVGTCRR